jgi:hypothetical protein
LKELAIAWEGVKESYCKHGEAVPVAPARREYSGQFNVRIDKRLHRALAIEAARAGVSLNALVAQKLAMSIKSMSAADNMQSIAASCRAPLCNRGQGLLRLSSYFQTKPLIFSSRFAQMESRF